MAKKGLMEQDLSKLDVAKLHPLSPEVISSQATMNISTIGHVAHGKSNVVKAISGVQVGCQKQALDRWLLMGLRDLNLWERCPQGDHYGCALLSNVAVPARCGQDIDVPDTILNVALVVLLSIELDQAAKMSTLGPSVSGFSIRGLAKLGHRDEKEAAFGANLMLSTVPRKRIVATGEEVEFGYFFISSPSL
ncbi:hypothetical protein Tco_0888762 [Tanacetum coccineum]